MICCVLRKLEQDQEETTPQSRHEAVATSQPDFLDCFARLNEIPTESPNLEFPKSPIQNTLAHHPAEFSQPHCDGNPQLVNMPPNELAHELDSGLRLLCDKLQKPTVIFPLG